MSRRAIILVLDSFGIGATADAAQFGDAGADTLGHIAEACADGRADKSGVRSGPLRIPNLARWGLGRAAEISTGAVPPGLADGSHRGRLWLRRGGKQGQGHAERPLGNGRLSGAVRLGLFPARAAVLPACADPAAGGRIQAARHSRRLPRLGHGDHRGARRGAYQDRQADLLHLGRQRVPGRRARAAFRIGAALSLLRARQGTAGAAQHRTRDRAAVRRREPRGLPPHRPSPRLHHAAAGRNAARSRLGLWRAMFGASARSPTSSPIAASPRN